MDDTPVEDTPVEDRLRRAFAAGIEQVETEAGPPVADPAELSRRRAHHHRRRQAGAAAAAAIVLVAALGGGWALGRDSDPTRPSVEQVAGPTSTSAAEEVGSSSGTSPGVALADDDLPLVRPTTGPEGAPPLPGAASTYVESLGPYGPSGPAPTQPSAPLFSRTLDDGTVLDVRGNRYDTTTYALPPFWDPPGWCFPTGDVYVGARLPAAVGQASGVRYDAVPDGRVLVATTIVGGPEGHPQWLAVVQVPASATDVRAEFAGGGEDAMTPVDGLAVLTAPAAEGAVPAEAWSAPDEAAPAPTVVATAADGSEVGRFAEGETGTTGPRTECMSPKDLPAPGPEQPADPTAAEAAVRAVWDRAFGHPGSLPVDEQLTLVDDPRGLAEAQATVAERYADQLGGIVIPVDGVVFATPEQAYIEYTVDASGAELGTFSDRFAELVLVDGGWKVTRASACNLAALGGGQCPLLDEG